MGIVIEYGFTMWFDLVLALLYEPIAGVKGGCFGGEELFVAKSDSPGKEQL